MQVSETVIDYNKGNLSICIGLLRVCDHKSEHTKIICRQCGIYVRVVVKFNQF